MKEVWKDIIGYEGLYQVSNTGKVKSLERYIIKKNGIKMFVGECLLKARKNSNGYLAVYPCKDGKCKAMDIHRLVGLNFLLNPFNYKDINHIDGNKTNNNANNLEWVTRSQNIKHAYQKLRHRHVCWKIRCIENDVIYNSSVQAAKELGINALSIRNCVNGHSKSAFGYHFIKVEKVLL